jgi:hypothetical protein
MQYATMKWPKEIVDAFNRGLGVEPEPGWTKAEVLQFFLDEATRRAVWRAQGDPARLGGSMRWPFTPLGSVVPGEMSGKVKTLQLRGPDWSKAVDLFFDYCEQNAQLICDTFRDEMEPYDDLSIGK